MTPSKAAIDLCKQFEGFRDKAYPDPGSGGEPWTIGYGTTIYPSRVKVKEGDTCTEAEAEIYLENDLQNAGKMVEEYVDVPLTQNQFDALCVFTYNVGGGAFRASTLLILLNDKRYSDAAAQFPRWSKSNGIVLRGLVLRRAAERDLFLA